LRLIIPKTNLTTTERVYHHDRKERAGVIFADMDLIGIPHRIVMSEKTLAENKVEYKKRTDEAARMIDVDEVIALFF
jgi:prolyl-tRNA synthetase